MTLVELHVDVARVANALERIVFLLEKIALDPPQQDVKVHQATLDDLHVTSEEDIARMQTEQMDFAERYRVAPGSPAMMQALVDWEDQQRSIHGEKWEPPEDWRAIYAAVERNQFREPAKSPGTAGPGQPSEAPQTSTR